VAPPPPPPEPPTLVIAYSDVNNNQVFDAGDVMIAKIVDTDKSGTINPGDTIKMGQYPTSPAAVTPAGVRGAFEPWRVTAHTVAAVDLTNVNLVSVTTPTGWVHDWWRAPGAPNDQYVEYKGADKSDIFDDFDAGNTDYVDTNPASASQPASEIYLQGPGKGDDSFLDVIFY
jgi:hypothetical protein